jgi:uncharacterized damage-inducible protein DinB
VWVQTTGGTLGFHLKHLAGSVDRISTYLIGGTLTEEQLRQLSSESNRQGSLGELLDRIHQSLQRAEERLGQVDPAELFQIRAVGRKELPSTVIGLLVHLAEHTQRHLGQAITLAQVVRGSRVHPSEPADEQ